MMKRLAVCGSLLFGLLATGCSPMQPYASATGSPPPLDMPSPTSVAGSFSETPSPTATPTASPTPDKPDPATKPGKGQLVALPEVEAPKITQVVKAKFTTTKGDLIIEIYPQAAPNAAKRFIALIRDHFYDNTPVFRVVPGFVAQFGINDNPKLVHWCDENFKDDITYFKLEPGVLAFAKAGPDTNSTQVFINYQDNSQLCYNGNFTAFAKIVKGYELTPKFVSLGDNVDQGALKQDTKGYLATLKTKPDFIKKAVILP